MTVDRKSLAEFKFQGDIFLGAALSPYLFVIVTMLLNQILRKYPGGYKFTKSQKKYQSLNYMDDIKQFAKKN